MLQLCGPQYSLPGDAAILQILSESTDPDGPSLFGLPLSGGTSGSHRFTTESTEASRNPALNLLGSH